MVPELRAEEKTKSLKCGDLKEERLRLERSKYASEGTIRGKEKDEILGTKLTMRLL